MIRAWAVIRTALASSNDEGAVAKLVRCFASCEIRGLSGLDSLGGLSFSTISLH